DGTNILLYVDGVLEDSALISGLTRPRSENSENITIGTIFEGDTNDFRGRIADLKIFDHALSLKEILELNKAKIMHFKLDDEDLADSAGYLEDATNSGAVISTESISGRASYSFSSGSKYIAIAHATSPNFTLLN